MLNYKKPALYVIVLCILVSIIAAGCLMTDPKTETPDTVPEPSAVQPTVNPMDDREKTKGPFFLDFSAAQFSVPSGWCDVGSNVFWDGMDLNDYNPLEEPYIELAPDGIQDCRIRIEVMTSEQYESIFIRKRVVENIRKRVVENMTASETTVRFYPATMYAPAGSDQWQYLVIPAESVYCVIENRFTAEEWKTYESGVEEILATFRAPGCEMDMDEAIACAKTHFTNHEGYSVTALRDYNQGCWNVIFRKDGEPNEVVCLGICGEFREHHQESFYTGDHHGDDHHDDHH